MTRRLDRQVGFDDRSRAYGVRPLLAAAERKTTLWDVPAPLPLDQGTDGACVGFGWSAQLAVGPVFNPSTNTYAFQYYRDAQYVDRTEGRHFPHGGATVLAGAKVAKNRGLISGYRWAFGIDDVIDTLCQKGPVVLGVPWYRAMNNTESDGRVLLHGPLVGGHCILATGYVHGHRGWGGNWIRWTNSWGSAYGVRGNGFIRDSHLAHLLGQSGEACIADEVNPVVRVPWWKRWVR